MGSAMSHPAKKLSTGSDFFVLEIVSRAKAERQKWRPPRGSKQKQYSFRKFRQVTLKLCFHRCHFANSF
jgi:hypothetical protein